MPIYIYHLCCPDTDEIRYIGKSNNPEHRFSRHLQASKSPENYAQRWIATLLRAGKKPVLRVAREVSPDENWQEVERAAIAEGFSRGLRLTNTSAGGEGVLLRDPEDEKRRIQAVKEAWERPEVREAQSKRQKAIRNTPESIEANRARMLEKWKDPEYAALNARRVSEAYSTPEARKAQSERTLKANKNPEVAAARAAGIKAAWAEPGKKEEWVANLTASQNTPEAFAVKSAQMKALHQDPEFVARRKARMADPEMIKRRGLAISAAKQKKKAERLALQEDQKAAKLAATTSAPYTESS